MRDGEMTYRRVHRAPREILFECMTTAEHLTHFWGPVGTTTPIDGIVVDLRPGGAFETLIVNDRDGTRHLMKAVYETVDPPSLVSWREVTSRMVTTLVFVELGDGTTEVITHQRQVPDGFDTPEARAGWATSLDRFAEYVALNHP